MAKPKTSGPKLPVQQLVILAAIRFADPLALTSVFPYLPEMIKSFGVPQEEVAKWAGITSAVFSMSQSVTAVPWGRTSDSIGRKPTLLLGLLFTMTCFVVWGTSTSLTMAIIVRGIQGGSNGNVGTIRTMVAEMVPQKSLQPRAFTIMPMVWSIGSVFGPSFGGFFARPAEQFPGLFGHSALFTKFPFLLPNLIAAVFFVISALCALLFLEETLDTRKHRPDWGLDVGDRLLRLLRRGPPSKSAQRRARLRAHGQRRAEGRARRHSFLDDDVRAPLLGPGADSRNAAHATAATVTAATTAATAAPAPEHRMFTYQTVMALVCYTLLALHSVAFDQVLPVFLNYPRATPSDLADMRLPLRFTGGFGLSSGVIGTLFTINALVTGVCQFVFFPPICARMGPLRLFRTTCTALPFIYLLTPYTALIPGTHLRYAIFCTTFAAKGILSNFTFPCITIILTNTAPSVKVLGTLNGYATLVSGLGRAFGPAMTGATFTWGVRHGYIIAGWALLSIMATVGAFSTLFLQEGSGVEQESGEEELEEETGGAETDATAVDAVNGATAEGAEDSDKYGDYDASDDDEDDDVALLRDVAADDDEDWIHGVSKRPNWARPSRANGAPLPAPASSLFASGVDVDDNDDSLAGAVSGAAAVASSATASTAVRHRRPSQLADLHIHVPASTSSIGRSAVRASILAGTDLREPDEPGSDDPDAATVREGLGTTAATGVAAAMAVAGVPSSPLSPTRTRHSYHPHHHHRTSSSVSTGNQAEDRAAVAAALASANAVPLSPVAAVDSD